MPGPVERWLETFMCKQYANVFEGFGFKTLQSVCQLQITQLQAMGIPQEYCDKILENVHVLRQSLSLSGTMNYPEDMSGNIPYGSAGNGMSHPSHPSMGYPNPDSNPMAMMSQYAAMQGYREQVQNPTMMSPPHYPNASSMYRSQQQQHQLQQHQQQLMSQQINSMYNNQNYNPVPDPMLMNSMGGANPMFCRSSGNTSQGAGSPSIHPPPHPHLRQGGLSQNPQQVADNILQMASSTYSAQTVQVPLNKARSAPYHNPRTNYNMANAQNMTGLPSNMSGIQGCLSTPHSMGSMSNMSNMMSMPSGKSNMQANTSRQMMQPAGSPSRLARNSGQYGYPNSSPHPHQPRTSPISPMTMHSPASQHSNHSVQNNPSPGPLQSPVGGSIRSPVSPMTSVGGMHSPHTKQTHMTSPSHNQTMRSPIQQMKHINSPMNMMNCTPVPSPGIQNMISGNLRSPHSQSSQLHSPHQQYYPHIQQASQPQSHYSPASQCVNSPMSHTSSPPYIQSSGHVSPSMSLPSPHSAVSKPSPSGSTSSINYNVIHQPLSVPQKGSAQVNPLQSLEKLVMLPETQVVDPKSVVNDDCLSSHSADQVTDGHPKNFDRSTDPIPSRGGQLEIKQPLEGNHDNLSTGNAFQPTQKADSAADAMTTSLDIGFPKTPEQRPPESVSIALTKPSSSNSLNSNDFTETACKNLSQLSPVISTAKEQVPSKNNSPDTSNHAMNSNCDNIIQGTAKIEEKRKKQENMSPKKRFLGSQPLLNGNSVNMPLPVSHNSISKSEINTNGPETKLSVNDISKSLNSEDIVIKASVGNNHMDHDDNSITETYVSKKLKQKRMVEKNAGFSSMTAGDVESNGQSGPVSCAVSGVIQATPRFGTAVYDDVSEASDLEEGELSVRKDSVKTYTRDALLSSPFKNSIHKSYKRYDTDSDDSLHEENVVIPFRDEQFQDKKDLFNYLEEETPSLNKDDKSLKVSLNHLKSRSPSPLSDSSESEKSNSPKTLDEVDAKDFPRSRITRKSLPKETKPKELFEKSLPKESPTKLSSTLDSNQVSKDFSDDSCDQSPPMSPGEISWADIINPKSNQSSHKTAAMTVIADPKSAKKRLSESSHNDSCEEVDFHNSPEMKSVLETEDFEETVVKRKSRKRTETSKFSKVKKFSTKGNSNVISSNTSKNKKSHKKSKSKNSSASKKSKKRGSSKRATKVENDRIEIISEEDSIDAIDVKQFVKTLAELPTTSDVEMTPVSSEKPLDIHETPYLKKRGRPPGSKNKIKKDKKHSKRKRDDTVYNSDNEKKCLKPSEKSFCPPAVPTMKRRKDTSVPNSGPFIRLEEDMFVIMNASLEDVESKPVKKKKPSKATCAPSGSLSVQISNLPSDRSVLVPAASPCDETLWYCCICRKHSSYKFLGDLFGPYYAEGYQPAQSNDDRSDKPKQRRKKMFVLADQVPNYADLITKPVKTRKQSGDRKLGLSPPFDSGAIADLDELWVHEDCALWSDGVYLIENNIYGLQEAANIAASATCSSCREVGASIGCLHKGCSQKYHYVCAIEKDCYLDEENFSLVCLKHKDKRLKTTDQSSRKVS